MNLTTGSTFGSWNRRRTKQLIAACVAGLSLSVVVVLGTTNVWESGSSSTGSNTALDRPANPIITGTAEDLAFVQQAFLLPRANSGSIDDRGAYLGLGQPGEIAGANEAVLIDVMDLGSIAAGYVDAPAQAMFGTAADAAFAAESIGTQPNVSVLGDALGLGQPGEIAGANEAVLIDVMDLGSITAGYVDAPAQAMFGTAADAAFAAESIGTQPNVSVLGDALGIGQPGEGLDSPRNAPLIDESDFGAYAAEYHNTWSLPFDGVSGEVTGPVNADEPPFVGSIVNGVYVTEPVEALP